MPHLALQLETPVDLKEFACLRVPRSALAGASSAAASAAANQCREAPSSEQPVFGHGDPLALLGRSITSSAAGLPPCVARLSDGGHELLVVCHQGVVPALYKGLRDASSRLGIVNLPPPKSCVHMKATANPAEAHAAFSQAVSAALSRAGWQPLEAGGWMLPTASGSSGVGGAAPDQGHDGGSSGEAGGGDSGDRGPGSALQEALTVRLELELQPPKSLLLVLTAGQVRYCHMALPCLLDAARSTSKDCAAALAGKGARDVLASLELLRAVNRAISVEGVPCCLLPSMTVALVSSVALHTPHHAAMRDAWLLQGRQLPVTMPYVLHVRFDHDPDAPEVPFPPCCVIGASGLTAQPVTADVQRRCEVTVAEALVSGSFNFWGGANLRRPAAQRQQQQEQQQQPCHLAPAAWSTAAGVLADPQLLRPQLQQLPPPSADGDDADAGSRGGSGREGGGGKGGGRPIVRRAVGIGPALQKFLAQQQAGQQAAAQQQGSSMAGRAVSAPAYLSRSGLPPQRTPPAGAPAAAVCTPAPLPAARPTAAVRTGLLAAPQLKKRVPASGMPAAGAKRPAAPQLKKRAPAGGAPKKRNPAAQAAGGPPKAPRASKAAKQVMFEADRCTPLPGAGGRAKGLVALLPPGGAAAAPSAAAALVTGAGVAILTPRTAGIGAGDQQGQPPRARAQRKPATKASDLDAAAVDARVRGLAASPGAGAASFSGLTLPELRCFLKGVGAAVGGKKADLLARVAQHLGLTASVAGEAGEAGPPAAGA